MRLYVNQMVENEMKNYWMIFSNGLTEVKKKNIHFSFVGNLTNP